MKDLEKMKQEFEEKIELAKLANMFEEKFGVEPQTFATGKSKFITCSTNNLQAAKIFKALQPDEDVLLNGTAGGQKNEIWAKYRLQSYRDYHSQFSTLRIEFKCKGITYWIYLRIDDNEALEKYFTKGMRGLSSSELSTYKPTKNGILCQEYQIPCRAWQCDQIAYHGGYFVALDEYTIQDVIESIINF